MSYSVQNTGLSFSMSSKNYPLDSRTVVDTKSDILKKVNPYIGMIVYAVTENVYYVVTELGPRLGASGKPMGTDNNVRATESGIKLLSEILSVTPSDPSSGGSGFIVSIDASATSSLPPDFDF